MKTPTKYKDDIEIIRLQVHKAIVIQGKELYFIIDKMNKTKIKELLKSKATKLNDKIIIDEFKIQHKKEIEEIENSIRLRIEVLESQERMKEIEAKNIAMLDLLDDTKTDIKLDEKKTIETQFKEMLRDINFSQLVRKYGLSSNIISKYNKGQKVQEATMKKYLLKVKKIKILS